MFTPVYKSVNSDGSSLNPQRTFGIGVRIDSVFGEFLEATKPGKPGGLLHFDIRTELPPQYTFSVVSDSFNKEVFKNTVSEFTKTVAQSRVSVLDYIYAENIPQLMFSEFFSERFLVGFLNFSSDFARLQNTATFCAVVALGTSQAFSPRVMYLNRTSPWNSIEQDVYVGPKVLEDSDSVFHIRNKYHLFAPFLDDSRSSRKAEISSKVGNYQVGNYPGNYQAPKAPRCYDQTVTQDLASTPGKCSEYDGVWDSPVTRSEECPFYDPTRGKGGVLKNGYCEMPTNVQRKGYRYYDINPDHQPHCYCERKGRKVDDVAVEQYIGPCCTGTPGVKFAFG